ncbi:hypothetical protein A2881_03635 [Candidatus Peribacteria bacterium RIFCSPHIGHO2_01_FULL_55_13]|nr:MAG: hypothetical protein A2881_03635 [Candidatus Peribacteria bacterium RIFCSPHIGHO2_01_FULL_55_13]
MSLSELHQTGHSQNAAPGEGLAQFGNTVASLKNLRGAEAAIRKMCVRWCGMRMEDMDTSSDEELILLLRKQADQAGRRLGKMQDHVQKLVRDLKKASTPSEWE